MTEDNKDTPQFRREGSGLLENSSRLTNLGSQFEQFASSLLNHEILLKTGEISEALLATNENADLSQIVRDLGDNPNGYIYGIGAGNIFTMPLLFSEEEPPKAILSVDILPEAVLSGRIVTSLIRKSHSFDMFIQNFTTQTEFDDAKLNVIQSETFEPLRSIFEQINGDELFESMNHALELMPESGIIHSKRFKDMISVLAAIRDGWPSIKQLADENNIGFGLVDYYEPKVISYMLALPSFKGFNNIIYSSNTIDYLTQGVDEQSDDPMWDSFRRALKRFNNPSNVFIFTTIKNDLELVATKGLATKAPDNFWF